jgi:PAS domain S-box-containing protein
MADNKVEVTEQRFKTFFISLKEGVACIDYQGNVMHCNPAYCNMLGYSEEELIGRRVVDLIVPASQRDEFYTRLEARKKGQEEDYVTEVFKKNGDKIWIDIKSRNIFDDGGKPYAYLVSVNDITDEKHKIEDLEAFTGSAAHDLRAPLARISSLISLFETENLNEDQKLFLSMIEETSIAMRQLLQDLLIFSKLGATQLEKTQLDLNEIVKEICTAQTPSDFTGEIIIRQLPSTFGNESAIRQLFTNLISNAIKYSSKKDKSRIEIAAYAKNKAAVYFIKDNGVGLSPEQISKLFIPFKRFHSDFEGNGLGLAIVKRVIEKHSGNIWVESEADNGVVFNFTLTPDLGTV